MFAAWTAGMGMIHAVRTALLWGSGWLFRTATKDKLLLQVCETYHMSCLFFQCWCSYEWNRQFLPQAVFLAMKIFWSHAGPISSSLPTVLPSFCFVFSLITSPYIVLVWFCSLLCAAWTEGATAALQVSFAPEGPLRTRRGRKGHFWPSSKKRYYSPQTGS